MDNRGPLLSICISTYNREKYLKSLLDSIVSQKGFSDDVEICVYNDPGNDNTQQMIENYMKCYKNIRYHKNETRIGMIPSILNVAQMGQGKYIRLFSDDDIMTNNSLEVMLNIIKNEQPGLLLNKFFGFKNDEEIINKLHGSDGKIKSFIGIENLFDHFSGLKYSIDGYMMHCSLFCFKKDLFKNNLDFLLNKHGNSYMEILKKDFFAHIRIIYLPFGNTEKITLIEKDLVLLRADNISWNFVFKTCSDYRNLTKDLNNQYKINKKAYMKMKILYYYSVFTYFIIVHLQKILPKKIYHSSINIGRKIIKFIKIG